MLISNLYPSALSKHLLDNSDLLSGKLSYDLVT